MQSSFVSTVAKNLLIYIAEEALHLRSTSKAAVLPRSRSIWQRLLLAEEEGKNLTPERKTRAVWHSLVAIFCHGRCRVGQKPS